MDIISVFFWVGVFAIVITCAVVVVVGCFAIKAQGRQGSGSQQFTSRAPVSSPVPQNPSVSWDRSTSQFVYDGPMEGWTIKPDGSLGEFIGAPAWFQPKFESFKSAHKRQLGEKEFMKQCWKPYFIERLNYSDEVKRQAMWLTGKGAVSQNDPAVCQIEALYWVGKQDGEDFVAWFNRHLKWVFKKYHKEAEERFGHKLNLKENHERAMRKQEEEGLCIGVTMNDGSSLQEWWKDGRVINREWGK